MVKTNYDMIKYLGDDSETKLAMKKMEEEFGPMCEVDLVLINREDVDTLKNEIGEIDNVLLVLFDESTSTSNNKYLLKVFIKGGTYSLTTNTVIKDLKEKLVSYNYYISGGAVDFNYMSTQVAKDMILILILAIGVIALVLLVTSNSYIDPLVLFIVLGIAITINLGTNYFLGEISFITSAICLVMQLALTMDYSIMFLHRYIEERKLDDNKISALKKALKAVIIPIMASAATTVAGLIALVFMNYKIGFDIGIVLSKGVIIGFFTVITFMPLILLIFDPLFTKTLKKKYKNSSLNENEELEKLLKKNIFYDFHIKTRLIVPILALVIFFVTFFVQLKQDYSFNMPTSKDNTTKLVTDKELIQYNFGYINTFVVIIEKSEENELKIVDYLRNYKFNNQLVFNSIQSVEDRRLIKELDSREMANFIYQEMGFPEIIGNLFTNYIYLEMNGDINSKITPLSLLEYLATKDNEPGYFIKNIDAIKSLFPSILKPIVDTLIGDGVDLQLSIDESYSLVKVSSNLLSNDSYSRIITNMDMKVSSNDSFKVIDEVRKKIKEIDSNSLIVSESGTFKDIKDVFSLDMIFVSILSFIGVFICILIAFKNFIIPVLLTLLIQSSIFILFSLLIVLFDPLFFLIYIIVMCIIMGACVDYAILFTSRYIESRITFSKEESLNIALKKSLKTIITSGSILVLASLSVGVISSVEIISLIGFLLALGSLIAIILIVLVLPQIIILFDKFIIKKRKSVS
jgi:predicted RND superfamily exporter protein